MIKNNEKLTMYKMFMSGKSPPRHILDVVCNKKVNKSMEVDHYGSQYSNFITSLYQKIRQKTYGIDIGQNGWLTVDEQEMFVNWLNLDTRSSLLDVACGSGGPTLRIAELTNCFITGIDIHEAAIEAAKKQAEFKPESIKAQFMKIDAGRSLPFENEIFDAIICIDAINHLPNRLEVLKEWNRILKPSGQVLFTDPVIVTGMLTKEEIEIRASIGYFLFVAEGIDDNLLEEAGFKLIRKVDRTENMAKMATKWYNMRQEKKIELIEAEGKDAFDGQQEFFKVCADLGIKKNLSRFAFHAIKSK